MPPIPRLTSRTCGVTSSRRSALRSACEARCPAVLGAWRGTRGDRDRAAHARRSAARRAVRPDGGVPANAAALPRPCSSTRVIAAACRRISIAAFVVPIRPAARSSRCCRARSKGCRRSASTSTSRSARCLSVVASSSPESPVEPQSTVPSDEIFAQSSSDEEPETPEQAALRRDDVPDSDDEAVIAGTLRSPWKWEELVVESAVVGGRTRADGGQRWRRRFERVGRRLPAAHQGAQERRAGVGANRGDTNAISRTCNTCGNSRCRLSTRSRRGPNARRGASG